MLATGVDISKSIISFILFMYSDSVRECLYFVVASEHGSEEGSSPLRGLHGRL